jgi:hypothetical protein
MAIPLERLGQIHVRGAPATSRSELAIGVAAGQPGRWQLGHMVSNAFSFGVAIGIIVALATRPTLASVLLLGAVVLLQALSTFSIESPAPGPSDVEPSLR